MRSSNDLEVLFTELDNNQGAYDHSKQRLKDKIQARLDVVYTDWTALQKAIVNSSNASTYMYNDMGEVCTWFRFAELSNVPEREREYLEAYLQDNHYIRVDWKNDCFEQNLGPQIIITEGGEVYCQDSGSTIISPSEYLVDGEFDHALRNKLIEQWMGKNGYFPGVFSDDGHGNIFPVNTQEGGLK